MKMTHKICCLILLFLLTSFQIFSQSRSSEEIRSDFEILLQKISVYEYDQSRTWLQDLQTLMHDVYQDPVTIRETEKQMLSFLESDASLAGKHLICNYLATIASKESLPILNGMLKDESTAEMALMVLEKIPDPKAVKILTGNYSKSSFKVKVAIINTLGVRRDPAAVKMITGLIYDQDPLIIEAALSALGSIGTDAAAGSLSTATERLSGDLKWTAIEAWLKCADRFVAENRHAKALTIYDKAWHSNPPISIRRAALNGLFLTTPGDPIDFIITHLQNCAPEEVIDVISLIYKLPDDKDPGRIINEITGLSATNQIFLFTAIASHGDRSVHNLIIDAINSNDPVARLAGLKAISKTGDSSDVLFLAEKAATMRGNERDLARESLYTLKGKDVDQAILSSIETADTKIKVELIRSIGERNIGSAIGLLLKYSESTELAVRMESMDALGKIAYPDDLPEMIGLLLNARSERERKTAETAIYLVTLKMPDGSRKSESIMTALPVVKDLPTLHSFIALLGMIGDARDYPVLKEYLYSGDPETQLAAIRALSGWPDATPMGDLKSIVQTTQDPRKHTLAMRGFVQVLDADQHLSYDQKFAEIRNAWESCSGTDEKKIVLSGLGKVITVDALRFAVILLDNSELVPETEAAIMNIAYGLSWGHPEETRQELNRVLKITANQELKQEIEGLLKNIVQ